jgi:hypothetical protein
MDIEGIFGTNILQTELVEGETKGTVDYYSAEIAVEADRRDWRPVGQIKGQFS